MIKTKCAICGNGADFKILYEKNFDPELIDKRIFSARRIPDRLHYRMVKCNSCGLVRANPILPLSRLERLYEKSEFTYSSQVEDLNETYERYLRKLDDFGAKRGNLVDIGCGNGFFLKRALELGYKKVWGVEPSSDAVAEAPRDMKKQIICDVLRSGLFPSGKFNVICCFQTLDHVPNPNEFLSICHQILKPGGLVLFLNHDVGFWLTKLLGEKSPIIDVEHIYLFDQKTMRKIFEKNNFKVLEIGEAKNTHSLGYWLRLSPLPLSLKKRLLRMKKLFDMKLTVKAGNLYLIAGK